MGALIALTSQTSRLPRFRASIAAAAFATLVASMLTVDPAAFPATGAALPVFATAALIAANPTDPILGRLLRSRPAAILGRLSYSWYLWHWPILVLGREMFGSGLGISVALAWFSLVPAWLSFVAVEEPIRWSARLAGSPRQMAAVAALFVAIAAGSISGGVIYRHHILRDPVVAAVDSAAERRTDVVADCAQLDAAEVLRRCSGGNPTGEVILVVGDSHAAHWIPAIADAAADSGLRWAATVRGNCPSIRYGFAHGGGACATRQEALLETIADLAPAVVVMSHSLGYIGNETQLNPEQLARWRTALTDFATKLQALDIELLLVLDVPRFGDNPLDCAANRRDLEGCGLPTERLAALRQFHHAEIEAITGTGHGITLDPTQRLCGPTHCELNVDGIIAYADAHHLTSDGARLLTTELQQALDQLLS